jgi:hypothetical protein
MSAESSLALALAMRLGIDVAIVWASTEPLEADLGPVRAAETLWCAPGSPSIWPPLFVPQVRSTREQPHTVVVALLQAALDRAAIPARPVVAVGRRRAR